MEFYASTVEEAVEKAASELGMPATDLDYEVVDEGSQGFLGIGVRDARIRVKNGEAEAPAEEEASEGTDVPAAVVDEGYPEPEEVPSSSSRVTEPETPAAPVDEDLLREIEDLSEKVIEAMGFGARVDVYETEEYVAVDISSDNTALLIGQKGETIDALQFLINSAVYRKRPFSKRIVLDSEGYRQRRVEAIQGMAHRSARRAVRERRQIEMPPMSAAERRVVHLYLRDNPKVTTSSEGKGDDRRVIISPSR